MKRVIPIIIVLALLLSACSTRKTVYADSAVEIVREGRFLTVTDAQSGEAHTYTLRRVKRSESPVKGEKTLLQTDNFTIRGVGGKMLIVEENGKTVYIVR